MEGGLFHHRILSHSVPAGAVAVRRRLCHGGLRLHHPVPDPAEGAQPAGRLLIHGPHVSGALPAGLRGGAQCVAVRPAELRGALCPGDLEVQPVHPQGAFGLRHDLRLSGAAPPGPGAAAQPAGGGCLLRSAAGGGAYHPRPGGQYHRRPGGTDYPQPGPAGRPAGRAGQGGSRTRRRPRSCTSWPAPSTGRAMASRGCSTCPTGRSGFTTSLPCSSSGPPIYWPTTPPGRRPRPPRPSHKA